MPAVGLDISDNAIRFVELIRKGTSFVPRFCGEIEIAPGIVVSGSIIKKDELIKAVSSISKKNGYRFVKASLPETKAYVFSTSIPNVPEADISDVISFKIEESVPVSSVEAIFDYTIIGKNEKGEIEVSVTVFQENVIQEYLDMFMLAGLVPRSFDLESRSIARALVPNSDSRTYLIAHIGLNKTVFGIVRNGVVRFTSTLHVGSNNFINAISKSLSIDPKQVQKLDSKYIFENRDDISGAVVGAVAVIKEEIEKLSVYWFTHKAAGTPGIQKIDEILLSGKDATIPGVLEHIAHNIKIPVKISNPWECCFSYNEFIPEIGANEALDYVTAIGLSLPKKIDA